MNDETSKRNVKALVSEYHQLSGACSRAQAKIIQVTNRRERILEEIAKKITTPSPVVIRIGSQSFVVESGTGKIAAIRLAVTIT